MGQELSARDAQTICHQLGMSSQGGGALTRATSSEELHGSWATSRFVARNNAYLSFFHVSLDQLNQLPDDLRRKLFAAGHVYVTAEQHVVRGLQFIGSAQQTGLAGGDDAYRNLLIFRVTKGFAQSRAGKNLLEDAASRQSLYIDLQAVERVAASQPTLGR